MNHLFITPAARLQPRWQAAFPQAEVAPSAPEAERLTTPPDIVWIICEGEQQPLSAPLLATVTRLSHQSAVVVLANAPQQADALQALQAGARGYAHALSPVATLQQIATVVTNAGIWVPADLMAQVMGHTWQALDGEQRLRHALLDKLTEREREVALAVVQGASNKQVARTLNITERTVKAHLTSVFHKLEITDRMQLILKLAGRAANLPETLSTTR